MAVLLFSVGLFGITKKIQNKYIYSSNLKDNQSVLAQNNSENSNKEEAKEEVKEAENSTDTSEQGENKAVAKTPKEESTREASKKENISNANTSSPSESSAKKESSEKKEEAKPSTNEDSPKKVEESNVVILNTIEAVEIVSAYTNIEGRTVETVTKEILDSKAIQYTVKAGYFSSIAGLKERSQGKASGWCYYVNGNKAGVGAGAYTLKKGDKLVWKFLKDGINE